MFTFSELAGYRVLHDGKKIGRFYDILFDLADWTIPYLVVDLGFWSLSPLRLIPPKSVQRPRKSEGMIQSQISKEEIMKA